MVIGGAGGHALEILEELQYQSKSNQFVFFVDPGFPAAETLQSFPVVQSLSILENKFKSDPLFTLGVGLPDSRQKFMNTFEQIGGKYYPLHSARAHVSATSSGLFDAMAFSFVGPQTQVGKGVLVNLRANVHHESVIGDYSEIGPGALILGRVIIGKRCRIGAGAVILPGVEIGDQVVVGAGAVVTKNFPDNQILVGVPAAPLRKK